MITTTKIWLSSPHMGGAEQGYVSRAFKNNRIAPMGQNVSLFEKKLENYYNGAHVAALSSGTSAIHIALKLLGVSAGDEVICQSFTFVATANPIVYLGAMPVFVDSERDTWNISPDLLEKAIKDRLLHKNKMPKAIIAVNLYGMPYKIDEVRNIANKYDIPVVEDCAEALGSKYKGESCGGFGDFGILSFNGNKIITTSGGGALIAKDEQMKKNAMYFALQAQEDLPHYEHLHIGYNYALSNVAAGIGCGQMEVLGDRIFARRNNFKFYLDRLGHIPEFSFLEEPEGYFSNRWLSCIITPSYEIREKIRVDLMNIGVESRPLMKPLHQQPIFKGCPNFSDGTAIDLFNKGLCLPSGSNLSLNDLERITTQILKTINR